MKKLILLLIIITTFKDVIYASFPATQNTQTEVVELVEYPNYGNSQPVWGILSFSLTLLSLILFPNLLLTLVFSLLSIIFGAIGFNKKLKGLAITGFFLGLLIFILTIFVMSAILFGGGLGAAFGG